MTNYVPSIPDCERWKKYVSKLARGRSDSKLNPYVTTDSPMAEIKVVSPAEGDLAMVKSRAKQYKQKKKELKVILHLKAEEERRLRQHRNREKRIKKELKKKTQLHR
jgi:hypothetical protein